MIRVALVDDHALVRQGIAAFLQGHDDIELVVEASTFEEAVEAIGDGVDVALIDLFLGRGSGIELLRRFQNDQPRVRLLALSSDEREATVLAALRAGAMTYLTKDVEPEALAAAIRMAVNDEPYAMPRIARYLVQALRGRALGGLSDREIEVLCLLSSGRSNAAIADRLFLSEKTVKWYVSSLLAKLDLTDRTQAAAYAWRMGLMDGPSLP